MNQRDLVDLLKGGVGERGGRWADLGAGEGAFTDALAELLGPEAHITAVDKDSWALRAIGEGIETRVADFTKPLDLRALDGVVMANSLHFVRDKLPVVRAVMQMLKPEGRLLMVEYGSDRGNPWVPYPMSYRTWEKLADEAGLVGTVLLHTVPSRHLGSIYSALSRRPAK
ncbi:MAG TPA: class I SAM-dependent methyltransferase [Candidatus Dormibacteraeota bacterium]